MHVEIYYILVTCDHTGECANEACHTRIWPTVHVETLWKPGLEVAPGSRVSLDVLGNDWTRLGDIRRAFQSNECSARACACVENADQEISVVADTCYLHGISDTNPFGLRKHMYRKIFVKAVAVR